jgi:putrescine---pyruvate transaminase
LRKKKLIEATATKLAPYFQQQLQTLRDHRIVGEVRGIGMLGAVELVRDKHSRQRLAPDAAGAVYCRNQANSGGLMVRQTGDAMITAPPLICNRKEIDNLVEMLARALDQTAEYFGIH